MVTGSIAWTRRARAARRTLEGLVVDLVVHGEEQLLLAVEVLVDGAAGVAGRGRDLVERGPLEALAGEDVPSGVDQGRAGAGPSTLRRPLLDGATDVGAVSNAHGASSSSS